MVIKLIVCCRNGCYSLRDWLSHLELQQCLNKFRKISFFIFPLSHPQDFEYDGAGPDAFFWVGTEGSPSAVGTILPYPFKGKFFEYEDGDAPILTGRFNKVRIIYHRY